MLIESSQLLQWESHYRAAFVNSLTGFKSANLVGTKDIDGRERSTCDMTDFALLSRIRIAFLLVDTIQR